MDPLRCPACGGQMRIISFIEETKTIDRIIRHLELTFEAEWQPRKKGSLNLDAETYPV